MRLIDADEALRLFGEEYQETKELIHNGETQLDSLAEGFTEAYHIIKYVLPAVDAVPVVHTRWDDSGRYTFPSGATAVRCTNCGCALTESEYRLNNWNYCPVCGAKMDGGDNDA